MSARTRRFLFLRGHASPLWPALARALEAEGCPVRRVALSLADAAHWGPKGARSYRGRLERWEGWLDALVAREGITDILYHGEAHPYHRTAQAVAGRHGALPWVVEFGYFRPDWLVLERGGMGAFSDFPRDPHAIRTLARGQPDPDFVVRHTHSPAREIATEIAWQALETLGRPLYPGFRADRPNGLIAQAPAAFRTWARGPHEARRADGLSARLSAEAVTYHLVLLQLFSDYQVRQGAGFPTPEAFLRHVLASFAAHAPAGHHLVVKRHPLDNGAERWPDLTTGIAREMGVPDRVACIKGGDLRAWLRGAKGAVTINSTAAIPAIGAGIPVCALGRAVYDVPGLTHQGGLDRFWAAPDPVDAPLARDFFRALAARQVKGSFYHPEGRALAVSGLVARLLAADPRDG
ncbi:capsular biosynthesis protein [Palleronia sediminis]|uniref:Capsular biosynthesis protein n=1 Tax=Palleronia sediminis TaxID=2547833 RepID=A0A4R6AJ39_9RHOB|nr:capsular biosynthesis protein [Palleronia sediminis]TDL83507.1 capsular biosynthesis protein [Palleronia sediminis]